MEGTLMPPTVKKLWGEEGEREGGVRKVVKNVLLYIILHSKTWLGRVAQFFQQIEILFLYKNQF